MFLHKLLQPLPHTEDALVYIRPPQHHIFGKGPAGGGAAGAAVQTGQLLKDPFYLHHHADGLPAADFSKVAELCRQLDVPYTRIQVPVYDIVFNERKEKNPCSLCAKLRRGALHTAAQELGCNKVALGHHLDDAVETFYMNLWREGRIGCFSPVTQLDRRGLTLIRPMLLATEHEVRCAVKEEDFPIVKSRCPADGVTVREQTKDFVRERCRTDHAFRQKTLHALQESGIDGWRPVHTGRTSNPSPKEGMHHADAEL